MSAGSGQWHRVTGLGGLADFAGPASNWAPRDEQALAWDRFQRAVQDGSASEIRSAREHLIEVTR